jgi:hypothetical protein
MENLTDLVEQQVDAMIANKSRFEQLKVGGLVKRNLNKTNEVSTELEKVAMEKAPADLKPEAERLAARRKVAFEKALAAFGNSVGGEDQATEEDDSD